MKWTTLTPLSKEYMCGYRVIFDIIARCLFNDARSGKNHSFVVILLIRKY